ncbi:MAG: hypothetical protein IJB74_01150 [Clostridia bacterium]|nr:hypothetical protein [Clostridia bacterium]
MDEEITERLSDFGIASLDSESIFNVSLKSIFSYFKKGLSDYLDNCMSLFTKVLGIIISGGAVSLIVNEKKYKSILNSLLVPVVTLILVEEINLCISSALSLLKVNGNFMLTFVPVYAISIAVSGNPATAVTYNTLVMGLAQALSAVINYGFVDLIGCFFCLAIAFSVNDNINYTRFFGAINRFITFILGLISTTFASVLSVKGIFSAATDSVAAKSIRFAIGSLIPVIGSSISESYSTLVGSIGILKNSVAVLGLIAIVLINLPVITEIAIFNILLNVLSFISEILDCKEVSDLLHAFAGGVKIIGLLIIFEAFILIVSTALMLSLKGG